MEYTTERFLGGMWNAGPETDRAWHQATLDWLTGENFAGCAVSIDSVDEDNPRFGRMRFLFKVSTDTMADAESLTDGLFEHVLPA